MTELLFSNVKAATGYSHPPVDVKDILKRCRNNRIRKDNKERAKSIAALQPINQMIKLKDYNKNIMTTVSSELHFYHSRI